MFAALKKSFSLLGSWEPDLMVGFGSRFQVPYLLAAIARRYPFLLHEANAIAGRSNRLFSRWALWTGIYFEKAKEKISAKCIDVDFPLRKSFAADFSRQEAKKSLGFSDDLLTLLVVGGSQGARYLNQNIPNAVFELQIPCQVIHVAGKGACLESIRAAYPPELKVHVVDFTSKMPLFWKAADVVCCRSGAGTIAEMLFSAVPALLIPYPHAMDDHQRHNAIEIAASGCAIAIDEKHIGKGELALHLKRLFLSAHEMKKAFLMHPKTSIQGLFASHILETLKRCKHTTT